MAVSHVICEIFNVEKYHDLEIPVKGHSRSSKVIIYYRIDMVSYSCSIVILSLRCTVFQIFDFKNAVTLKTRLGSVKVIENVTIR